MIFYLLFVYGDITLFALGDIQGDIPHKLRLRQAVAGGCPGSPS